MLLGDGECGSCLFSSAENGRHLDTVAFSNLDCDMRWVCGFVQLRYWPGDLANSAVFSLVLTASMAIFCTAWRRRCGSDHHLSADSTTPNASWYDPNGW